MEDSSMRHQEAIGSQNKPNKEKTDLFDMSFMTVHPAEEDGVDHSSSGKSPTKEKAVTSTTTYSNVRFHGHLGVLVLTPIKVMFQPYEERDDDFTEHSSESNPYPDREGNNSTSSGLHHSSWRWRVIGKHQISPASTGKCLLKLVSREGGSKGVTFEMPTREELEKIRKDISNRMKPYKYDTNGQAPSSPSTAATANSHSHHSLANGETNGGGETTALLRSSNGETDAAVEDPGVQYYDYNTSYSRSHKWVWIGIVVTAIALIVLKVAMQFTGSTTFSQLVSALSSSEGGGSERSLGGVNANVNTNMDVRYIDQNNAVNHNFAALRKYLRG